MNKNVERYIEYFQQRVGQYDLKGIEIQVIVEQRASDQPSRIALYPNMGYLYLNESILRNQNEEYVIDKPLRTLCCMFAEKETERLVIRHFLKSDLEDYVEIALQEGVRALEGSRILRTREEAEADFQVDLGNPFKFALYEKSLGKMIGHISITPVNSRAVAAYSMGYGVSQDYQRQGYMSEAAQEMLTFCFEGLHLPMVEASYFEGNVASQRILEKLGMRYEGLRKYGYYDMNRGPVDIHVCSITKEEYFKK